MTSSDGIIPFRGKKPRSFGDLSLEELEDDELMLMARGGAEEAFDALVRRHQETVGRVASKILGSMPLADDAVQNTFLAVYGHIHDYRPQGKFKRFLFRILMNQCRLVQRAAGRDLRLRQRLSAAPPSLPHKPDEDLLERERVREVDRALGKLGYKLKAVLVLRFAAELSYSEIAGVLEIPLGTVKSRINTGIVRLRRMMGGREP
jgi:RNA polymerase sigma-70 factor (ECF subfamily)